MKILVVSILMLLAVCVVFILCSCVVAAKRADKELERILLADQEIQDQKGR